MSSNKPLELPGLDPQNPLAFLAALGVLRALDDRAVRTGGRPPRLGFRGDARPMPVIVSDIPGIEELIPVLLQDAADRASDAVLTLAYDASGRRVAHGSPGASYDLKPPPAVARELLEEAVAQGGSTLRLAAAFFSDVVRDNKGATKPTAFHFTAGQQEFLAMVTELRAKVTAEDFREALIGPWLGRSQLPSLSWDATASRNYALRASDPSKEKRGSIAAANWLGVLGLTFFPVFPFRRRLETTAVRGSWKNSTFTWPIWEPAATAATVSSLLRLDVRRFRAAECRALGITGVFASRILRSEQGGYGSFTPAAAVPPA
ncbi:MAG TPA: hypothetical protein VIL35_04645 [Vicinamibacterales bacterium]